MKNSKNFDKLNSLIMWHLMRKSYLVIDTEYPDMYTFTANHFDELQHIFLRDGVFLTKTEVNSKTFYIVEGNIPNI